MDGLTVAPLQRNASVRGADSRSKRHGDGSEQRSGWLCHSAISTMSTCSWVVTVGLEDAPTELMPDGCIVGDGRSGRPVQLNGTPYFCSADFSMDKTALQCGQM